MILNNHSINTDCYYFYHHHYHHFMESLQPVKCWVLQIHIDVHIHSNLPQKANLIAYHLLMNSHFPENKDLKILNKACNAL